MGDHTCYPSTGEVRSSGASSATLSQIKERGKLQWERSEERRKGWKKSGSVRGTKQSQGGRLCTVELQGNERERKALTESCCLGAMHCDSASYDSFQRQKKTNYFSNSLKTTS